MPIISQEEAIQEELNAIYELIINKKELVKAELTFLRSNFDRECSQTTIYDISNGTNWLSSNEQIPLKLNEYEFYLHITEIMNDFKDENERFPEYYEMFTTLDQMMLQLAKKEQYEQAAILKPWVDKIKMVILKNC